MKKILALASLGIISYAFYHQTKELKSWRVAFIEQELTLAQQKLAGKTPLENLETEEFLTNWISFLETGLNQLK